MPTHSEWPSDQEEVGVFEYEGREFRASGSLVSPTHAIGYMSSDMKHVASWDGTKVLGLARIVSSWETPRSFVSSRMNQVEAQINGIWYTGRTAGKGMLWRGKRMAGQ